MKAFDTTDLNKNAFPKMPEAFKNRVELTLEWLPEKKGESIMENRAARHSVRRGVVIAAVAVMVLGTTVFAAGRVSQYVSSGSPKPVYKELPTAERVEMEYGYNPILTEEFANGYKFDAAYVSNTKAQDEQNNTIEKFKELEFDYVKDGDVVKLNVNTSKEVANDEQEIGEITQFDGIELKYYTYLDKFVPEDYELTDEDKAAEASGELVFSYGTDDVTVQRIQSVSFQKDGINYLLFYSGEELTKEDLILMTEELLTTK